MPDPILRDFPDVLKDAIVAVLQASSAEQEADVRYKVRRDQLHPISQRDLPLVNVWVPDERPESGSRTEHRETAVLNLDLCTRGEEAPDDKNYIAADQATVARLDYLRAQVVHALYALKNADFGFPVGIIARKGWPSWQMFQTGNRTPFPAEDVVGGRLSLEIEYSWTPEDIASVALEILSVSDSMRSMWSALLRYGGDT